MTNRKWLYAAIIIFAVIVIAGLVFLLWPSGQQPQEPDATTGSTDDTTVTTKPSGIDDSIFDDGSIGDKKLPVAGQEDTDVPQESTADGTNDPDTEQTSEGSVSGDNGSGDQSSGGALPAPGEMTYEQFAALSPADQRRYQESFGTDDAGLDAFFAWYNAAKTKYEQENPPIDVGDGVVDLSKLPT